MVLSRSFHCHSGHDHLGLPYIEVSLVILRVSKPGFLVILFVILDKCKFPYLRLSLYSSCLSRPTDRFQVD